MNWQDSYRSKVMGAREALHAVQSGMRVYIHPGCAEPEVLVEALIDRAPFVKDVELVHLLTMGTADYVKPEMAGHFRHNAMFIGANVRQAVNDGRADYTPIYLSEIESLFESGQMPIDVALIQVSPPDAHGFCSFGVGVDTSLNAAKNARYVIAQVNDQMPRTYGDSFIHVSNLDAIVEASRPLCELPREEITELHRAIARHVATLIDDGCTLQLGIGGIPDAVLLELGDRKDLGVHTEMLSHNAIPLIEKGIINGRRKTLHPRKIVLAFVLGTKELFDYVHENPIFEFHPCSYTNNPFIIAQNDRMIAVNSTLQVDITGQVCSDSIGQYLYSGFGGQVDFVRGARHSKGGKPIIAMPSTARPRRAPSRAANNETPGVPAGPIPSDDEGLISRIVPTLTPGSGVVASRGSIHYVVTEWGIAYLHGKSIRERAEALIQIAHPKFRTALYDYCEKTRWLQRPLLHLEELAGSAVADTKTDGR